MKALPKNIPPYSRDLVNLLDKSIPHRCPAHGEDVEKVHRYAGKRELVDLLLDRMNTNDEERNDTNPMNWIEGDN